MFAADIADTAVYYKIYIYRHTDLCIYIYI